MKTQRIDHATRGAMLLLAMAMFCEQAQADIVGWFVYQYMEAGLSGPPIITYSNTSNPPVSALVSTNASFDPFYVYAEASQTIHSYVGPMFDGDITPFLSLSAETTVSTFELIPFNFANAYSLFQYGFILDSVHPYTFNFSLSSNVPSSTGVTLYGPGGAVASGSGMLPAGHYQLDAYSGVSPGYPGNGSSSFSLQVGSVTGVPEARSWLMMGLATACVVVGMFVRQQLQSRTTATCRAG